MCAMNGGPGRFAPAVRDFQQTVHSAACRGPNGGSYLLRVQYADARLGRDTGAVTIEPTDAFLQARLRRQVTLLRWLQRVAMVLIALASAVELAVELPKAGRLGVVAAVAAVAVGSGLGVRWRRGELRLIAAGPPPMGWAGAEPGGACP